MKTVKNRPGVILLPVFAVFLIFILLLGMLVQQHRSAASMELQVVAAKLINKALDYYIEGGLYDPALLDDKILGLGFYDSDGNSVYVYGDAPRRLRPDMLRRSSFRLNGSKSVEFIRASGDAEGVPPEHMMPNGQRMMPHMRGMHENDERRPGQKLLTLRKKYELGVYLKYKNSAWSSQRWIALLIIISFVSLMTFLSYLIFRLERKNRQLESKSEQEKQLIQLGEAARTLAHEIKNPLGILKVQRDILVRKLPEGYDQNLEIIDREVKRLNTLVERVGDFLRNPVGKPSRIDLSVYLGRLYGDRDDVSLPGCEEGLFVISFDAERLRSVSDNIINNAVESGGAAEVSLGMAGGSVEMIVRDHGGGIAPELLDRVFEPFFTTKNKGSGLGLSVVKRLMDASGGRIDIENSGDGAVVRLGFLQYTEAK